MRVEPGSISSRVAQQKATDTMKRTLSGVDLQAQPDIVERLTGPLPMRVLVTAQAFGFGPAAAMAQVFDHLRPRVRYLAFAGEVHVTTSQLIAGHMQHDAPAVRTIPPRQVQHLLGTSELAVMTPGLGNIYEAAALAKRVFWLPPANASQGQQLVILRQRGLAPFAADWHEILPGRAPIDYWMPDPIVAEDIADAIV